jgi:hypothetical protein
MALSGKAVTKPEGGFRFISVVQLCIVWWAYREGFIQLRDVGVWFAAHELVARRCWLSNGKTPFYNYDEIEHPNSGLSNTCTQ